MNAEVLELPTVAAASPEHVLCAVRLHAPETVNRVPTHFILLLDVSSSMEDDNKLENCTKCISLILNVLTERDLLTLITFGDSAEMLTFATPVNAANKTVLQQRIKSIVADGCTNLSAGLGIVLQLTLPQTHKTGLLILTDGHANRGVSNTDTLTEMVGTLKTTHQNLSIHSIAYGHDHNAELLKGFAEKVQGSYNLVTRLEDTAFAFGDTLGGLLSCAFQNVRIRIPVGSILRGAQKAVSESTGLVVSLGDCYAGTTPLVLADIPKAALKDGCIKVEGQKVPSFEAFTLTPTRTVPEGRQMDIELALLRNQCTSILDDIKDYRRLGPAAQEALEARIRSFAFSVADLYFNTSPVIALLREEVGTLRALLDAAKNGDLSVEQSILMTQHSATLGTGRGYNSPMAPSRHRRSRLAPPPAPRRVRFSQSVRSATEDEDPTHASWFASQETTQPTLFPSPTGPGPVAAPAGPPTLHLSTVSAFQNRTQSNLATMFLNASLGHEESS